MDAFAVVDDGEQLTAEHQITTVIEPASGLKHMGAFFHLLRPPFPFPAYSMPRLC
jgi:hypothetical protein